MDAFCKNLADLYGPLGFSATMFAEPCRSAQIRKHRKPGCVLAYRQSANAYSIVYGFHNAYHTFFNFSPIFPYIEGKTLLKILSKNGHVPNIYPNIDLSTKFIYHKFSFVDYVFIETPKSHIFPR